MNAELRFWNAIQDWEAVVGFYPEWATAVMTTLDKSTPRETIVTNRCYK